MARDDDDFSEAVIIVESATNDNHHNHDHDHTPTTSTLDYAQLCDGVLLSRLFERAT